MTNTQPTSPVVPSAGVLRPLGTRAVTINDGFWRRRQELNTDTFIDHADHWITSMGWVDSFKVAAGGKRTIPMQGKLFTDSDIYKMLEGMVWEQAARPSERREARIQEISQLIAGAQGDDGYINTFWSLRGRDQRYSDLGHGHELYCAGHLIQAAVARLRAGVSDTLTETAIKFADRICEDFGPGGIDGSDGHPEIEVALMELYRATGDKRYLDQAGHFIEWRGHNKFERHAIGPEYHVDDLPVREAKVLRGHVVRAMYFTAGAVDYAVETGDTELLSALETQWANTWAKRTYITGGMGARHLGESFGDDWELPPDRAYCETCGAVGAIMVAWRLLLATGKVGYADAIERLMYNMIATHLGTEGDRIFYVNRLQQRDFTTMVPAGLAPFRKDTARANWFWVSCCPTNINRLMASMSDLISTTDDAGLAIHQFMGSTIKFDSPAGVPFVVDMVTQYPWEGRVQLTVKQGSGKLRLRIRVPEWATGARLTVGGQSQSVSPGYATVERDWQPGDVVVLEFPIEPRVSYPDPRIDAVRATKAVEYGPLVYCAEELVGGADLNDVHVDVSNLEVTRLEGVNDAKVGVKVSAAAGSEPGPRDWPYGGPNPYLNHHKTSLTLVPYYAWSNRGPSKMRVWLPD